MPPPADADADALLAAEQAAEASALWVGGDFDAAHQTLQRLEATLPTDARVRVLLLPLIVMGGATGQCVWGSLSQQVLLCCAGATQPLGGRILRRRRQQP